MPQTSSTYHAWPVLAVLVLLGCSSTDDDGKVAASDSGTPNASSTPNDSSSPDDSGTPSDSGSALVLPSRAVTGPIGGGKGKPFAASAADLAAAGYAEKEYFLEGTATAYDAPGGMAMDGKWSLMEKTKAAFKTRLLVRRPIDAGRFNGTVVVEWFNVSNGADSDPGFTYNADLILREGYAYVGVSAQLQGVQGGSQTQGPPGTLPLTQYDPERYGSLHHPDDHFCYDIFSQAGQVIRSPEQIDVLEGLVPKRLIAYGLSQSAMVMVPYVNGVHPLQKRYDGYFIHSRSGNSPPFQEMPFLGFGVNPVHIRDDIEAKVFQLQTETDVTGIYQSVTARQPDNDNLRTWEVAGAAHADQYLIDFHATRAADMGFGCPGANDGSLFRVARAALSSLDRWLRDGTAPAHGAVLSTDASGTLLKDEHGIGLGGVRTPDVDVPTRTLTGDAPPNSSPTSLCSGFGRSISFTPEKLMSLYPTHEDYVTKVTASANQLRAAGFLLEPEAMGLIAKAASAPVPR